MALAKTVDGFVSLLDGVHGGLDPRVLKPTSFSRGINASCREGLVHTRPGFVKEDVTLTPGLFQGAHTWSLNSGDRLVYVVDGILYSMYVDTLEVVSHGLRMDPTAQCYFVQAERFLVVQDGTSEPTVLEELAGVATIKDLGERAIDPTTEPIYWTVPLWPGTVMGFAHGRIHMVPRYLPSTTDNGRTLILSSDVTDVEDPSTCLYVTEDYYLSEGGPLSLPLEMGYIYGVAPFRNNQTGTGYGSLVVFARRGVCAFDMSIPRSQWKADDQQLGQVLFFGPGTTSPWSIFSVNGDLAYRGPDGIRFIRYTGSNLQGGSGVLSNIPQSAEMSPYLDADLSDYMPYVSGSVCNNRLYMTTGGTGIRCFQAAIVLDLAVVSGFQGAEAPIYNGIWQLPGQAPIAQVLTAYRDDIEAQYAFAEGPELYRLDETAVLDEGGARIRSRIVTKLFDFDTAVNVLRLKFIELGLSDLYHDVDITMRFRPEGFPLWTTFGTKHIEVPEGSLPQRRRKVRLGFYNALLDSCDPAIQEILCQGQAFQIMLEFEGYNKVNYMRLVVSDLGDDKADPCAEENVEPIVATDTSVIIGEYLE